MSAQNKHLNAKKNPASAGAKDLSCESATHDAVEITSNFSKIMIRPESDHEDAEIKKN